MNTHRIFIARGFGDIDRHRGRRNNVSGKAIMRRAVKKAARTHDAELGRKEATLDAQLVQTT